MRDVHLRIYEAAVPHDGTWKAELRQGFPDPANPAPVIVGGTATYSNTELERDVVGVAGPAIKLNLASVRAAVETNNNGDPTFFHVGARLFELLERTGVAAEWRRGYDAGSLRTYLEIPDSLAEWPWEFLAWKTATGAVKYAFNRNDCPLVRMDPLFAPVDLKQDQPVVRILLVSGQQVLTDAPIEEAATELRRIRKILQTANVSVMVEQSEAPLTQNALEDKINRLKPHILHFIGHGVKLPSGQVALQFKPSAAGAQPWFWDAQKIGDYFSPAIWKPRLVVINACQSGQFVQGGVSVARAFLEAGIPAVVAAQASLTIDYAREFARYFYAKLTALPASESQAPNLGSVVSDVRRELSNISSFAGIDKRHWALPVLTLRARMEKIVSFTAVSSHSMSCELMKKACGRPGRFVNRTMERWSILSKFAPPVPGMPAEKVIIIEGPKGRPKTGKEFLMLRIIRDFLDANFHVRYAPLSNLAESRTSIDVLKDWRGDQTSTSPVQKEIPHGDFTRFDQAYSEAKQSGTLAAAQKTFLAFKEDLQKARNGKKVVLILDKLRQSGGAQVTSPDFREGLKDQLFLPLKNGTEGELLKDIHALIVTHSAMNGQATEFDTFGLAELEASREQIDNFSAEELKNNYLDEFVEFTSSSVREIVAGVLKISPAKALAGSPDFFKLVEDIVVAAKENGTL